LPGGAGGSGPGVGVDERVRHRPGPCRSTAGKPISSNRVFTAPRAACPQTGRGSRHRRGRASSPRPPGPTGRGLACRRCSAGASCPRLLRHRGQAALHFGAQNFAEPTRCAAPLALVRAAVLAFSEQPGGGLEAAVAEQQLPRRAGAGGYRPVTHRSPGPAGPPSPAMCTATAAGQDRRLTRRRPAAACGSNRPTWTAGSWPMMAPVTHLTVVTRFGLRIFMRLLLDLDREWLGGLRCPGAS